MSFKTLDWTKQVPGWFIPEVNNESLFQLIILQFKLYAIKPLITFMVLLHFKTNGTVSLLVLCFSILGSDYTHQCYCMGTYIFKVVETRQGSSVGGRHSLGNSTTDTDTHRISYGQPVFACMESIRHSIGHIFYTSIILGWQLLHNKSAYTSPIL